MDALEKERVMDVTRQLKLAIAKIAYKEIQTVIDKFKSRLITIDWNKRIIVDDELFQEHELSGD